jgi:hypothetical protein
MDFVFAKLIFTLRLEYDVPDPYTLFRTRSDFMEAFRKAVCHRDGFCEKCAESCICPYHQTFSQALSEDGTAVKRHQKPPLPFVFDFPLLAGLSRAGQKIEIGLVLAGSAINYVHEYLNAVDLLFKPATGFRKPIASIELVESVTCTDFRNRIMEDGSDPALDEVSTISVRDLVDIKTLNPRRLGITIASPMRLLQDGKPIREFSFPTFVRPLLRRMSSLAFYYYGNGLEVDYKWLSAASDSVALVENGFRWTDWPGDRRGDHSGGIIGSGVFEGDLTDFHTFLLLGEYFHVGKGSSFGLGRYRIDEEAG